MSDNSYSKLDKALELVNDLNGAEKAQLQEQLSMDFDISTPNESEFEEEDDEDELSYRNMYPTTPDFVPFDIETSGFTIQDEVISVGFIFGDTMYLHAIAAGFSRSDAVDALKNTDGVGSVTADAIVESFDNPSNLFTASETRLRRVDGVGEQRASAIRTGIEAYVEDVEGQLTEKVREHSEVDDLQVELRLASDEAELVRNVSQDIEDNFIDGYNVFTTYNGYSRYGGFDYKMLAQAGFYAGFSEHPLNGYGHVDLKTLFDDRDVFNTTVKELSADALGKTFNAGELDDVVQTLNRAYVNHVEEAAEKPLTNVIGEEEDEESEVGLRTLFNRRFNSIRSELDSDEEFPIEAVRKTLDTLESETVLSRAELAGLAIVEWNGGNRKKDTTKRLEVLEEFGTLNIQPVIDAMDEWCDSNNREFPSNTRTTLDGIYHAVQTRGNDRADTIDPLDEKSGLVPEAFDDGELEDVLLHLADDLIKTRYLSEVMRFSCPSDEFRVTVL